MYIYVYILIYTYIYYAHPNRQWYILNCTVWRRRLPEDATYHLLVYYPLPDMQSWRTLAFTASWTEPKYWWCSHTGLCRLWELIDLARLSKHICQKHCWQDYRHCWQDYRSTHAEQTILWALADKIISAPMPSILVMQPHWYASAWTRILMAQVLQHGHAIMNLDSQSSCTVHVVASSHLKM